MIDRIIYTSNGNLRLVEYQKCDDLALYEDWLDPDTQKGYNGIFVTTFENFQSRDIRQRFFAMIQLTGTKENIGAVGISPPETIADLAIWVFRPYRKQGYGTAAFALATKYAVEKLRINELHAGVYPENIGSQKLLLRCGYIPFPEGDLLEKHYLTGADITQHDYIYNVVKPI
ncbi:MAG: GNAT family N-acetyltransferase [Oscillospiraceae bacterium]|jgi:RimJ/RimL family protein N-acetyltransferase|nr:GNAT family N-acetyltransferase [Oscillospiraceae bacterium]